MFLFLTLFWSWDSCCWSMSKDDHFPIVSFVLWAFLYKCLVFADAPCTLYVRTKHLHLFWGEGKKPNYESNQENGLAHTPIGRHVDWIGLQVAKLTLIRHCWLASRRSKLTCMKTCMLDSEQAKLSVCTFLLQTLTFCPASLPDMSWNIYKSKLVFFKSSSIDNWHIFTYLKSNVYMCLIVIWSKYCHTFKSQLNGAK